VVATVLRWGPGWAVFTISRQTCNSVAAHVVHQIQSCGWLDFDVVRTRLDKTLYAQDSKGVVTDLRGNRECVTTVPGVPKGVAGLAHSVL